MTASSYFSSYYYPYFGRLHDTRGNGWAGKTAKDPLDWLQVDFGRTALVCAVATQGHTNGNEWVIAFSLSFSSDGASWVYSKDSHGNKTASLWHFILLCWLGHGGVASVSMFKRQKRVQNDPKLSANILLLPLALTQQSFWSTIERERSASVEEGYLEDDPFFLSK